MALDNNGNYVPDIPIQGGGQAPTPATVNVVNTPSGDDVMPVGGLANSQFAQSVSEFNATMAYNLAVQSGIDRRHALDIAMQEKQLSLQRSMSTGYIDGNPTLDRQIAQWQASGYLDNGAPTLERQATEWQTSGYMNGAPTLARQEMEGSQGLQYLNLLSQQRGPRDWLTYANTIRNAQGGPLPAYAQALANNQKIAGFGNTTQTTSGQNSFNNQTYMPGAQGYTNQPAWTTGQQQPSQQVPSGMPYSQALEQARSQLIQLGGAAWQNATAEQIVAEIRNNQSSWNTGQQAQPTNQLPANWQDMIQQIWQQNQQAQPAPTYSTFDVSANKVRPDQWNNMTNSEQQMLLGQVENAGGDPTDWQQFMKKSWTQGTAKGKSTFGY
jgi:hypothetical protein